MKHGSLHDIQLDDQRDFQLTDSAMTSMGMSDDERLAIYTVVAGVLHLGNIAFEEDDKGQKGMAGAQVNGWDSCCVVPQSWENYQCRNGEN